MYGGAGKLGRGRGGGPAKRNIHSTFQPPSIQRPSATPGGGRLSAGGGHRNSSNTSAAQATVSTAEETFSLVRNNPLNFGMIIRLSPVLVEEIKRLEAQGGAARIKFDSSANNPAGNVIDVGGKEFRFTWSQETGHLCDIYEERRSGDSGDGLLVESGGAWRKLNVQRELDDSVKNHVKMRTVEAERKHKSRKAIILDHGNPSMKNPMILAAAEVNNTWRGSYKQKKEPPFKKMKAEPCSAVIPPKSVGKGGFSSSKLRASASPLLSTQEQSGVPLSPLRNTNLAKVHANREEATSTQENASTSEKEMLTKVPAGVIQNKLGTSERSGFGNKPTDLQSLLISLLMEKPHGMNLKALEKAIGETIPKSVKQIEPILKKIAVFQAPGRYILKPDVDLENSKKSLSESGSSPENYKHHRETSAPDSSFPSKADNMKEFEETTNQISEPYEELNTSGKIDIDHVSPDVLSDKKVSHNSGGSSSLSGSDSDSDSDSSDSGSDSRSPVGSGSGSSSDSESDASSNSKQGSDEDVDIMSDDDKEPKQKLLLQSDTEVGYGHNIVDEKDDVHGSDSVDLEKDLFGDNHEADTNSFPDKDGDNYADDTTNLFINHLEHQESEVQARKSSKRASDEKEHAKRVKLGNWAQLDGPGDGPYRGNTSHMSGRNVRDYNYEKIDNRGFFGNPTLDSPRSIDLNAQAKVPADVDNARFSERGPQVNDVFPIQKDNKSNKEKRAEDGQHLNDRRPPKSSRLNSGSHQKKHVPSIDKVKESVSVSTSHLKDSPIDLKRSPVINGRGPTLRRELSDLELGEFRENLHEEASGAENRFERNNSLKQSENKSTSDYWNLDDSKGKVAGRTSLDSAKESPLKKVIHKGRHGESGMSQGIGPEGYTETQRKLHMGVPHKHEKEVVPLATKDKKRHKSKDLGEKKKDFWLVDSSRQKKREMEACSDDSITSYTKYEKDEPEMKGPIRDLSQYNEYVQEYREKYDCYHTLNKILESYRSEFQTFGRDLEHAKGRDNDRYNKILEQLLESYRQCGMKHKRLKKIFVVLHHELQHLKDMIRDFAEKQSKG